MNKKKNNKTATLQFSQMQYCDLLANNISTWALFLSNKLYLEQ